MDGLRNNWSTQEHTQPTHLPNPHRTVREDPGDDTWYQEPELCHYKYL